jgi:hypothetical protein
MGYFTRERERERERERKGRLGLLSIYKKSSSQQQELRILRFLRFLRRREGQNRYYPTVLSGVVFPGALFFT